MDKTVYIRVDGNRVIATGHVMRCISVASELVAQGIEVVFIVADDESGNLIKSKGFDILCLNSVWNQLDVETDKMCRLIIEHQIQVLLIDSYYVTRDYLQNLSALTKVFYIDDLNRFIYPVYAVINYSIYADEIDYIRRYAEQGLKTKFYLGCKYTPLRSEFDDISCIVHKKVENILITTGGTDQYNVAGYVADRIARDSYFDKIMIHIVSGIYNLNKDSLYQLAENKPNIIVHDNISNMAELMKSCDIAITAGGTTLYELCACAVPTIAVMVADNQIDNTRRFCQEKLLKFAGDIRTDRGKVIENVIAAIKKFVENEEERAFYSSKMKAKCISGGNKRIAQLLNNEIC